MARRSTTNRKILGSIPSKIKFHFWFTYFSNLQLFYRLENRDNQRMEHIRSCKLNKKIFALKSPFWYLDRAHPLVKKLVWDYVPGVRCSGPVAIEFLGYYCQP